MSMPEPFRISCVISSLVGYLISTFGSSIFGFFDDLLFFVSFFETTDAYCWQSRNVLPDLFSTGGAGVISKSSSDSHIGKTIEVQLTQCLDAFIKFMAGIFSMYKNLERIIFWLNKELFDHIHCYYSCSFI